MEENLESNCKNDEIAPEKKKIIQEFQPDSSIKQYLMGIQSTKLIGIINECCGTDYNLDCQVEFLNTEHFELLGTLDKSSVRGDLVAKVKENETENENKVVIELQSTKNKNMGFRMFIYSINVVDKDNDTQVYTFPDAFTIYTHIDDSTKNGFDNVHFKIKKFSVDKQEFSSENGDILTIPFPFVNLLAMDYDEFLNSLLEPLKILYPYKYRKNIELIKNTDEFQKVMKDLNKYVSTQGNDKIYVAEIIGKLLTDLVNICTEKPEEYKKELEIMENVNKSSIDILKEEVAAEAAAKATAKAAEIAAKAAEKAVKAAEKAAAEAVAKTKISNSTEIAKNLLGKLANVEIANVTGLSISQIEQLRINA